MQKTTNIFRLAALSLGLLALVGCDVTDPLDDADLRLDLRNVPVEIPESVGTVVVRSGEPMINTGTATNDTDIASIEHLKSIQIEPGFFTYTPSEVPPSDETATTLASLDGTIELFVFLGGVPVPDTPIIVTVEDGAVTAVDPQEIEIDGATVNANTIEAFLESLPPESRPELDGWESMTLGEIIDEINEALASGSVDIAIGVNATGDLDGTLRLEQVEFDAEVVVSGG